MASILAGQGSGRCDAILIGGHVALALAREPVAQRETRKKRQRALHEKEGRKGGDQQ